MKKILSHSSSMIVLLSLFVMVMLASVSAQVPQMADELRVENATGNPDDYVLVPVNITNVKNGPIMVIGLRLSYNTSVLNLTDVELGDLTKTGWTLTVGKKIILDTSPDNAMPNGSTGSIVLLNFSVIGNPGEMSHMNLTDIVLVSTSFIEGTAPAKNGTFSIEGIDITPPTSISNLQNFTGTTWINWTWTNPLDDDFAYTVVYLNGVFKTNTSSPYYNATNLTVNTTYEIGTHTVDVNGNVNDTWVNQTAKTEVAPTPTPTPTPTPVSYTHLTLPTKA